MSPSETADRIIGAIGDASWFAAVGETLTDAEIADAELYLAAIGRAGIAIEGAATQAAPARMVVTAGEHPFAVKFRLFEGGRWPLAILRGTYYIL